MSDRSNNEAQRRNLDSLDIDDAQFARRIADLIERGLERYSSGDVQGALSEWEHALALDPDCHRAREYAVYVRNHFSTTNRIATIQDTPEALAELDVPFGLVIVGGPTEIEPYEDLRVERGGGIALDMALPADYEPENSDRRYAVGSEEPTKRYGKGFSPERPNEFEDASTGAHVPRPGTGSGVDMGWDFEAQATQLYPRPDGSSGPLPVQQKPPSKPSLPSPHEMDTRRDLRAPERAVIEAELAAAISNVTSALMSIEDDEEIAKTEPPPAAAVRGDHLNELPLETDELDLEASIEVAGATRDPEPLELDLEPLDEGDGDVDPGMAPGRVVFSSAKPVPPVQISFRAPGERPPEPATPAGDLDETKERLAIPPAASRSQTSGDLEDTRQRLRTQPSDGRAPTQDPMLLTGPIELDDALLQLDQPTSELGAASPSPSPGDERKTAELARGRYVDVNEIGLAQTQLGIADDYDDIAGELIAGISLDPPNETKDARIRRRVSALIDRATSLMRDGNFVRAVVAVDLALQEDPESAAAQKLIHRHRDLLLEIYCEYIGDLEQVPALAVPMHELKLHEINHRAAFLLSRIDGALSYEEVLDICGMSRLEAFRHLARLVLQGVLEVR